MQSTRRRTFYRDVGVGQYAITKSLLLLLLLLLNTLEKHYGDNAPQFHKSLFMKLQIWSAPNGKIGPLSPRRMAIVTFSRFRIAKLQILWAAAAAARHLKLNGSDKRILGRCQAGRAGLAAEC